MMALDINGLAFGMLTFNKAFPYFASIYYIDAIFTVSVIAIGKSGLLPPNPNRKKKPVTEKKE